MEEEKLNIEDPDTNDNIQLAENTNVDSYDDDISESYSSKRTSLDQTKIMKQTWSIIEIYQKIQSKKLVLDPGYQRNVVWNSAKKTSFIESLYMGIIIPPIYVVEISSEDLLIGNTYEVVDGKQRLSTIVDFMNDKLNLEGKNLEYYADLFAGKNFSSILEEYEKDTKEMLSSVLDIYVITANSPEFTKYDIFSRLNKGSEKLRANEIRKAVYHSNLIKIIDQFVEKYRDSEEYKNVFSNASIKRYEDYGRFYKSIAFYQKSNLEQKKVEQYNSRPREMINAVLHDFQADSKLIKFVGEDKIITILEKTLSLLNLLKNTQNKEFIIDACIPFVVTNWDLLLEKLNIIKSDSVILSTFEKSPGTTTNVNKRLERVSEILANE